MVFYATLGIFYQRLSFSRGEIQSVYMNSKDYGINGILMFMKNMIDLQGVIKKRKVKQSVTVATITKEFNI